MLFLTRDGEPWTETDMKAEGPNALYVAMFGAFDAAINDVSTHGL